jgi:hypothetical protein
MRIYLLRDENNCDAFSYSTVVTGQNIPCAPPFKHSANGLAWRLEDSRYFALSALVSKHHCDAAKTFGSRRQNTQGLATLAPAAAMPRHQHAMLFARGILASLWHP